MRRSQLFFFVLQLGIIFEQIIRYNLVWQVIQV